MRRLSSHLDRRTAVFAALVALTGGVLAGTLAGVPGEVPATYAVTPCQYPNGPCLPVVRTAAVDVTHGEPGASVTPVEPEAGEDWTITGYWNTQPPTPCYQVTYQASATVSWTGSGWALSNVTTNYFITDIDICDEQTCYRVDLHGHGYRLIARLRDPNANYNLRQVVFSTTSVDDGYLLDTSECTLGDAVTPTTQTFTATDSGPFECGYSCDNIGTSLLIEYE